MTFSNMKKEEKELFTETLKGAVPGVILLLAFWAFAAAGADMMLLLIGVTIVIVAAHVHGYVSHERAEPHKLLADFLWTVAIFILASWLGHFLGGKGLLGILVLGLLFGLILLWRRRAIYMRWVRHIETKLYGAPRDELKRRGNR